MPELYAHWEAVAQPYKWRREVHADKRPPAAHNSSKPAVLLSLAPPPPRLLSPGSPVPRGLAPPLA
ncbi:uncharacterized protein TRAVEDRAFT_32038 [Trametes versicolor FP-101664 SS1]|uniref:uncharacterized protein n=1 Tax=Trametes versicolor (strain FP-101664) TaxID=717944 RepID=UPI0004621C58|nr:uncharacterized protein TRAVEDRAFT_32038 [Trametes versicolor FP-101664 SS1]EIW52240.1 hypothetical protein TRAVEDRAFT_32038 [Trametes versicolor FP-101664 SS1]